MYTSFTPADILLPMFTADSNAMQRYAVIACDQYTSEPNYWQNVSGFVGKNVSAYNLFLPEAYIGTDKDYSLSIKHTTAQYLTDVFTEYKDSFIYVERTLKNGKVRRGLVGKIDLEQYDFKSRTTKVRATESTVIERLPPRVAIRKEASIELPHIMLLINDADDKVMSAARQAKRQNVYDFDLMIQSGHVKGDLIKSADSTDIISTLADLESRSPLAYAVGDGNHSLAAAKQHYETLKLSIGQSALNHPARYALCEIVNIYDAALEFEPIYRIVFNSDLDRFAFDFVQYLNNLKGNNQPQSFTLINGDRQIHVVCDSPCKSLSVATLQDFLDSRSEKIDYIHGIDSLCALSKDSTVGILFDGMSKKELFSSVINDGVLPRKTFSMGHADDKRFYIEARKIKE